MPAPADPGVLEARVRALEARTGIEVVVALVDRADLYHGLRWRAFALGAALAGAAVTLGGRLLPAQVAAPEAVAAVLAAGLAFALAATLVPSFGRLFLEPLRAEAEARQRAESLFLEHGMFRTRQRTAVLLLASRYERQAVVLPDSGFRGRISDDEWQGVSAVMGTRVRAGRGVEGLLAGLEELERLLVTKGFTAEAGSANELPDRPLCGAGS